MSDPFDFRPLIPGASVPLRAIVTYTNARGNREGRLEFIMVPGEGAVEGVTFTAGATMGGNLVVRFRRGSADPDTHGHAYEVSMRDFIEAAWALDKAKPERAPGVKEI